MKGKSISNEIKIAAGQFLKEKEYWLNQLTGEVEKCSFPYDNYKESIAGVYQKEKVTFEIRGDIYARLMEITGRSYPKIHMVLVAGVATLSYLYTGNRDMIVGTSIERQDTEESLINTILPLRVPFPDDITFKEMILEIRSIIDEAIENQNYPVETLISERNLVPDVVVLLENIQEKKYVEHLQASILFSFRAAGNEIKGELEYNTNKYEKDSIIRIIDYLQHLLHIAFFSVNVKIKDIQLLSEQEKEELEHFNNTAAVYQQQKTIYQLFEEQVLKTPDYIAIVGNAGVEGKKRRSEEKKKSGVESLHATSLQIQMSYRQLNEQSDRLAGILIEKGVLPDTIVGMITERSVEMIIGILGILKAGGTYLLIDPEYPQERIDYILKDSGAKLLVITNNKEAEKLKRWEGEKVPIEFILYNSNHVPHHSSFNIHHSSLLAYIIYTSGSTGKPKGVAVEHRALVNYTLWSAKVYVKNEKVNFPLYTSIGFDLTITSLFTPLITGNTVYIYRGAYKEFLLDDIFAEDKVEAVKLTPIHLMIMSDNHNAKNISKIKRFIVGGDNLETQWAQKIHDNFEGNVEIYNEYGPTEATVGCMIYKYNPRKDKGASVPIGEPADNVQIYLLDKNMNFLPFGGLGELHIGGDGLARGYLNDPELTIAKFIKSPFPGKASLLYKTGDMARFLPGRQIEFLGRIDHQVKIRGFRIELGEIESQIAKFDGIKEVQVLANENENGNKYLCAYIVTDDRDIFKQTSTMTRALREYLLYTLAEYMIPSYFIRLANMPLTPHGKIDRKALPLPNMELEKEYVAPANEVENELVKVCSKIFGREKIGITDNYFELGGDSIKAIQIAAGMNKVGYKVEIQQIFQYPIISELACVIKKTERVAEQGVINETIPLTPIQKWFFSIGLVGIHHFNQAVILHFEKGIEEEVINKIFTKLQAHHDALRMSFNVKDTGEVVQINHGLNYPFHLMVYDFRVQEDAQKALGQKIDELQGSIDLSTGPLMKLGLFRMKDGDRLLIIIHHLVIDGVSWRILFEDIDTLCQQYQKREELILPLKTDSFNLWAQKLYHYANSPLLLKEKTYWGKLQTNIIPLIKKDFEVEDNYVEDADSLNFSLNKVDTNLLLTKVNNAFGTEINDILLTALGLALNRTFGHDKALISMEGHGREKLFEDLDITRTVGWFTIIYPVLLDLTYEETLSRQIKEVKETLRGIPNKGIGYQILEYLTVNKHIKDINFRLKPQIGFNYLGQFDIDVKTKSFGLAREFPGRTQKSEQKRIIDLEILGIITDKRLNISITFSKKQFRRETIEKLLSAFKSGLVDIISYCSRRPERELTPSDLTYKGLSIENLEQLSKRYSINDIYALAPMQEGMLFHTLYEDSSTVYCIQTSYSLRGDWKIPLVEKGLKELVKRYDILRTVFVYKGFEQPLQIVLKNGEVDFYYIDIRKTLGETKPPGNMEQIVKRFKEKSSGRSFEMDRGPLMRLEILHLTDFQYEFIWSFHHIIIDGWCVSILISDFLKIYNALLLDKHYQLPEVTSYREYIRWLEKQDKEKAKNYWAKYLAEYDELTTIPGKKTSGKNETLFDNQKVDLELDMNKTTKLNKLAIKIQVTLNTVIQTIWGILLGKYTNKRDVIFGSVVSGRPSEIQGVESIVGLFINTVPVRIRYEKGKKLCKLLHQVQDENVASEHYHHYPLAHIQSESNLKQNLLDHILVFENFPLDFQLMKTMDKVNQYNGTMLELSSIDNFVYTNYNFYILISPMDQLKIQLKYNACIYKRELIVRIGHDFLNAIYRLINNEKIQVDELILTEASQSLPYGFNDNLEDE